MRVRMSSSKPPVGVHVRPKQRRERVQVARGLRRPFHAGRASTCWTMSVFTKTMQFCSRCRLSVLSSWSSQRQELRQAGGRGTHAGDILLAGELERT